MAKKLKQVLSVSRRTDIPAFYMPWFMQGIVRGHIDVENPFNRQVRQVPVSTQCVHTIVFWSKNFGPFLDGGYGERLQTMGYHLLFNFTVNSRDSLLEPSVPPLDRRIDQLEQLCRRFGATAVQWRFDPICHYSTFAGEVRTNLADFAVIAGAAGRCGITTCTTSFMDHYAKIARRARNKVTFSIPSEAEKKTILLSMEKILAPLNVQLTLCCETSILDGLPQTSTIRAGACISGRRIMALYGGRVSLRSDAGQRKAMGCGCTQSVDVGSYRLHPCHHNCLFCYANPACDRKAPV
ncbi:hypothetical protein DSCO28_48500 [Desulfosarcina ovata subsp. sediminis]|uniref:DNA photolyase n=1 Tax=Desulfosarcina ovata subsp. sediminis TaxID=885957 RepID=A0A5K7ZVT0_9BACT|nr:DUF1848 family protein [Desulfosarcina ovata]BBO84284.1 hypothetical protein DSCO28_48500 [Desulfosarcina ovata subsp. sediminis]